MTTKKQIRSSFQIVDNSNDTLRIRTINHFFTDGTSLVETSTDTLYTAPGKVTLKPGVKTSKIVSTQNYWLITGIIFIMIIYVTMVYGPIAAFLVELFPTKIRYTSMSLPYHIGNGIFGGLTPFIATLLATIYSSDKLVGLYYTIIVAGICLLIGALYINNKIDKDISD